MSGSTKRQCDRAAFSRWIADLQEVPERTPRHGEASGLLIRPRPDRVHVPPGDVLALPWHE
jgi:hypothetical protein